jgi:hypothetical protein
MAGEWMDKGENKELSARTIPQDCNLIESCLIAANCSINRGQGDEPVTPFPIDYKE